MSVLKNDERAVFALREMYRRYGYTQYKMNKFEEYELYARNKDFLISDNIIAFTDTSGRLMALKPDVTLSIIKNTSVAEGETKKLCYNENVYRVPKGSGSFREIMQAGLECIGEVDDYSISEVLMLAARSLKLISPEAILDISHMDIVSGLIGSLGLPAGESRELLKCVGEKNAHGIARLCAGCGANGEKAERLRRLVFAGGKPAEALPKLRSLLGGDFSSELEHLSLLCSALDSCGLGDIIRIDFSVVNDMSYYNGLVFRGFVRGIPSGILSGGQYDKLMQKLGSGAGAIGFAVYLDLLERLPGPAAEYDVDAVVLYDSGASLWNIGAAVNGLAENGLSVMALRKLPEGLRYRRLIRLDGKEAAQ